MAPKKGPKKSLPSSSSGGGTSYPTIDPSTIVSSHRLILRLDRERDFYYDFEGLIWGLRVLFSLNGDRKKLQNKPLSSKYGEPLIFVDLVYYHYRSSILIEKHNMYLVAWTCQENWKLASDARYEIRGAERMHFSTRYPTELPLDIGDDIIRNCVINLSSWRGGNSDSMERSVNMLAVNICESVRFPPIHRLISNLKFSHLHSTTIGVFGQWLIKNWEKVSKVWKFWCRYSLWDPLDILPANLKDSESGALRDERVADDAIALLLDVSIVKEIDQIESRLGKVAEDPTIQ